MISLGIECVFGNIKFDSSLGPYIYFSDILVPELGMRKIYIQKRNVRPITIVGLFDGPKIQGTRQKLPPYIIRSIMSYAINKFENFCKKQPSRLERYKSTVKKEVLPKQFYRTINTINRHLSNFSKRSQPSQAVFAPSYAWLISKIGPGWRLISMLQIFWLYGTHASLSIWPFGHGIA